MANIRAVAVIGAGSWGTTIAKIIAENHPRLRVRIWAFEKTVARGINTQRENRMYLPGVPLPAIHASTDLPDAVEGASAIIIATPSKAVYDTCLKMQGLIGADARIAFLSKGLVKTHSGIITISEAIEAALPCHRGGIVAIAGPSHAEEVSTGFHTCLSVAGHSQTSRRLFVELLSCSYIECRETDDIRGVELGGALKNPAAIAAGMISVLPACGDNLAGALIAESMKEMLRIGRALGARDETLLDISGLGDLIATSLSGHSRNRRFGRDIAQRILRTGRSMGFFERLWFRFRPEAALARMTEKMHYLAEGAYAIEPLLELSAQRGVPLPVYRSLHEVLLRGRELGLMVETIKNPSRFESLYAQAGYQSTVSKKTASFAAGIHFKTLVARGVAERFVSDDSLRKRAYDFRDRRLTRGGGMDPGMAAGVSGKALSLLDGMNAANERKTVESISLSYLEQMADRFNPFPFLFLKMLAWLLRLPILRVFSGISLEIEASVREGIDRMKSSHSILYCLGERTEGGHPYAGALFAAAGLPAPRFDAGSPGTVDPLLRFIVGRLGGFFIDRMRISDPIYQECAREYLLTLSSHSVPLMLPMFARGSDGTRDVLWEEFAMDCVKSLTGGKADLLCVPARVCRDATRSVQSRIRLLEPLRISRTAHDAVPVEDLFVKMRDLLLSGVPQ